MTKLRLSGWGFLGLSVVIGAQACGGKGIHELGHIPAIGGEAGAAPVDNHAGTGGTDVVRPPVDLNEGGIDPGPPDVEHLTCPTCEVLTTTDNITALTATADDVFWVEHGSYDELRNYQGNGRLLTMPATGGTPTVVANDLEGPVELELSPQYFYLLVDESTSLDGKLQLVRKPRSGGPTENIQAPFRGSYLRWTDGQFAAGSDQVAWFNDDEQAVYTLADAPGSKPEVVSHAEGLTALFDDDTLLYLLDKQGLTTVPFAGGERTTLSNFDTDDSSFTSFKVSGDFIYALELFADHVNAAGWYITRMPKKGGPWKRFAELPDASGRLLFAGEHFAISAPNVREATARRLQQGTLGVTNSLRVLVEAPIDPDSKWHEQFHVWGFSSAGIFFADGGKIYRAPLAE